MKGLGQSQINSRNKSKQKLVNFIKNYQPCTSGQIRNNSKIRRNNVKKFLEELILEKKIIQIKNHYFTDPPPIEKIDNLKKHDMMLAILSLVQKQTITLSHLFEKQSRFIMTQPLRADLIHKKISLEVLKGWDDIRKIDFKKILSTHDFKQLLELSVKIQKQYIKYHEEFIVWYWIYRRFEYPRFKDIYINPDGIHPFYFKNGKTHYV